jgi:hypothetical protein
MNRASKLAVDRLGERDLPVRCVHTEQGVSVLDNKQGDKLESETFSQG